ncbi:insulinase family protein [bacterium]|nr:insulinase family protein [bacterium]
MKKIHQFTDSLTKIQHTTYQFNNGIKLMHALNPSSIDYALTVIVRAGSSFETTNNLPHGTAHFLEHIIAGNPNKLLKSKFEIDEFESGNKDEPEIFTNASTSQKYMYLYAFGNKEGSNRINLRIKSILDYPTQNISKYIEKERPIILAEQSHDNKDKHNRHLQFSKFLYDNKDNGFTHTVIGEKTDIQNITPQNLETFFKKQFAPENIIITLQTGQELLPSQKEGLQNIANIYPKPTNKAVSPQTHISTSKRIRHFKDEQIEGVSVIILMTLPFRNKIDYKAQALEFLFRSLMRKVSRGILREKLGLIYSTSISNHVDSSFKQRVVGYEVISQPKNFEKVLTAVNNLIEKDLKEFLNSEEGEVWFQSRISTYIFPRTIPYKTSYAERKGRALIEGKELFELDKAVVQALKVNTNDLYEFTKEFFSNTPLFWIESDTDGKKLTEKLKSSKLYNRFKEDML